ncbi:hypothetical protein EMCRGX_G004968 [Ephydatia muelleri]
MAQNKASQLYVASEKGDYDRVKRLLGAGAKVNKARSDDGCNPLYAASCNGHLDVVKTLLEAGANINQVYKTNTTPLYVASEKGHHDVVQTLLGAGADVNIARSDDGRIPLYIASLNGHLGVVKTLMEAGANISETNKIHIKGLAKHTTPPATDHNLQKGLVLKRFRVLVPGMVYIVYWIGAATAVSRSGLPPATIKNLGRWRSEAYKVYTRHPLTQP